ncbi:MAG: PAS domain S-box protein [Acidimicrobiales bacterium]|jgi:PAS domain S-box-containing protein
MATNKVESPDAALAGIAAELPDVVIVLDYEGRLLWGNHAAERMFGRLLDDSVGLPALELVHPDDLELVLRSLVSIQRKEIGTLIEVRARAVTGWRLLEVRGAPLDWSGVPAVLFSLRDLTERRRFEVARSEEAQFRTLVHNAAAVTILVSSTGLIDSVSGALSRMLGQDPELVEHRPLAALVSEPDRPALLAALDQAARGASASHPVTVEVGLLRHASDEPVPFELSVVNLVDDPVVGGFVVSAHDISARVRAERNVRETLSLLAATLESTADGILVVDTAGHITSYNGRFADLWHLGEPLLKTRDDSAVIAGVLEQLANPDAFMTKVNALYANPAAESNDVIEFKDGRIFERYSRPQRVDGTIVGRVWSFHDVTDTKRTEEELRESEQRFRQVFNQGPLGIALVDLDAHITNANRALCRFLGRTKAEIIGETFASFTFTDDLEKDLQLTNAMTEGAIASYHTETRFVGKHGDPVFGYVTGSMIRNELGVPVYGLRIVEDITKRKRLEHELASHATTASKLLASLTPRETEVLELLSSSATAAKMAEHLSVSVRTVETHLANAYRKLGVRSKEDAAAEFERLTGAASGLQQGFDEIAVPQQHRQ